MSDADAPKKVPDSPEQALENARIAYKYVECAYSHVLALEPSLRDRANKLIFVQAMLFAALSYAASLLTTQSGQAPSWLLGIGYGVGGLAAVVLAASFWFALSCNVTQQSMVPETGAVANHVSEPYFRSWETAHLLGVLTKNIHSAIEASYTQEPRRARKAKWLDRTLLFGFLLTVPCVALSMVVRAVWQSPCSQNTSTGPSASQSNGVGTMPENENAPSSQALPSVTSPADAPQTGPQEAPETAPSAAQDSPGPEAVMAPPRPYTRSMKSPERKSVA